MSGLDRLKELDDQLIPPHKDSPLVIRRDGPWRSPGEPAEGASRLTRLDAWAERFAHNPSWRSAIASAAVIAAVGAGAGATQGHPWLGAGAALGMCPAFTFLVPLGRHRGKG